MKSLRDLIAKSNLNTVHKQLLLDHFDQIPNESKQKLHKLLGNDLMHSASTLKVEILVNKLKEKYGKI
jgi:hypothetical protein